MQPPKYPPPPRYAVPIPGAHPIASNKNQTFQQDELNHAVLNRQLLHHRGRVRKHQFALDRPKTHLYPDRHDDSAGPVRPSDFVELAEEHTPSGTSSMLVCVGKVPANRVFLAPLPKRPA